MYFAILRKSISSFYNLKFIKSQLIKSSIVFLFKPEWLAKSEPLNKITEKNKYVNLIAKQLSSFCKKYNGKQEPYKLQTEHFLNCKNNQSISLVKKISSNKTISETIYVWLSTQTLVCEEIIYFKNIILANRFNDFLTIIYTIGLEWYIYINLRKRQSYQLLSLINHDKRRVFLSNKITINLLINYFGQYANILDTKCSIYYRFCKDIPLKDIDIKIREKNNDLIKLNNKSISYIIRSNLYHRSQLGVWRINSQLTINQATLLIRNLIYLFFIYVGQGIAYLNKDEILLTANRIFYLWQRKKR